MVQSSAHCMALSAAPANPPLMRGRAEVRAEGELTKQMRCLDSTKLGETSIFESG